jgi:hypothetical protein
MEPSGLLPCSQESATVRCPEPVSSGHIYILLSCQPTVCIQTSNLPLVFWFPFWNCVCFRDSECVQDSPRPPLHPISSFDGSAKSTHEAPRYEVFFVPLLLPHTVIHSSQYSVRTPPPTGLSSLSSLSTGGAGREVQGGGRICTTSEF